ncbi:MAG: thioredoxin-dependent thiol peroxidase [Bacteroidia bacterium]
MADLQTGDKAPDFTAKNQEGKDVSLKDFKGKKVVLYFYPKDFTSGCTTESENLRDHYPDLLDEGYDVLGVSTDDVESHRKFASTYKLPFSLLADPDKELVNMYGVYGEKNMYGKKYMGVKRTTFIIDEEGRIENIIKKVKNKEHAQQVLNSN